MKKFYELPHGQQVALAAWMVLLASEPLAMGEVIDIAPKYSRAVGDIASTVGMHVRKRINLEKRQTWKQVKV